MLGVGYSNLYTREGTETRSCSRGEEKEQIENIEMPLLGKAPPPTRGSVPGITAQRRSSSPRRVCGFVFNSVALYREAKIQNGRESVSELEDADCA